MKNCQSFLLMNKFRINPFSYKYCVMSSNHKLLIRIGMVFDKYALLLHRSHLGEFADTMALFIKNLT
jgi:hypothetical protein